MSERASKPKKDPRTRELGLIHILKAKLGLHDEQYRAVLWAQGRVESAKDLDTHGRQLVIKHLQAHVDAAGRKASPRPNNIAAPHRAELKKIEALLTDAGLPWAYADAVMRTQTRGKKERLEWCDKGELAGIISALERAALKRLAGEMQQTFGDGWRNDATYIAATLFGFDPIARNIDRYTVAMSRVLRWQRGELEAACVWPVDADKPACCNGCRQRALVA